MWPFKRIKNLEAEVALLKQNYISTRGSLADLREDLRSLPRHVHKCGSQNHQWVYHPEFGGGDDVCCICGQSKKALDQLMTLEKACGNVAAALDGLPPSIQDKVMAVLEKALNAPT